jgi:hypothetical protein
VRTDCIRIAIDGRRAILGGIRHRRGLVCRLKNASIHQEGSTMHLIARTCGRIVTVIFVASVAMALNAPARADGTAIAQVKTVSGDATIVRNGTPVAVKVGDPVFEKDTIQTGTDGAIGLTFVDNTVMSTGPNSEIAMDQYRFDSSNFNGAMLADMHKGTVTMVSGDIARSSPGAMQIKTPTAILGVRGTRFAIQVEGNR